MKLDEAMDLVAAIRNRCEIAKLIVGHEQLLPTLFEDIAEDAQKLFVGYCVRGELRKRIYIAGPYGRRSGLPQETITQNIAIAIDAARQLLLKGHNPFCPHLYGYVGDEVLCGWGEIDEAHFLVLFLDWVSVCDAVLRLPGESYGADREVERAKVLGIPVYHSVEEIP